MNYVSIEDTQDVVKLVSSLLGDVGLPKDALAVLEPYSALHWVKHVTLDKESEQLQPYAEHVIVFVTDDNQKVCYREYRRPGRVEHSTLIEPLMEHDLYNAVLVYKFFMSKQVQVYNVKLK